MKAASRIAAANGISDMTLDEINAEIAEARKVRRQYFWELVFSGIVTPLLNKQIVGEYREVLGRPKFHLTERIIKDVLSEINRFGIYLDAEELDIVFPDPKDRVFYEVVMEERKSENYVSCDREY